MASVGSKGDSYDNALAEAFNIACIKAELIRNKGPWTSIDDLEIAAAEYLDWFNHRQAARRDRASIPPADARGRATTMPRRGTALRRRGEA